MKLEVIKFKNYCEPNRAHYNDSGQPHCVLYQ